MTWLVLVSVLMQCRSDIATLGFVDVGQGVAFIDRGALAFDLAAEFLFARQYRTVWTTGGPPIHRSAAAGGNGAGSIRDAVRHNLGNLK